MSRARADHHVVSMRDAIADEPIGPSYHLLRALAHSSPLGYRELMLGERPPAASAANYPPNDAERRAAVARRAR